MNKQYLDTVRLLLDVMLLLGNNGITPWIRRCFTVYLAGHNRPIHELLPPQKQEIGDIFKNELAGMTRKEVTYEDLEITREKLFSEFPYSLDESERSFLISMKQRKPDWEVLDIPGIEKLPALKWKLINIEKLAKNNPAKYNKMLKALETKFI